MLLERPQRLICSNIDTHPFSPQIDGDSEEDDKTIDFQGKEVGRASYRICSYIDTSAVEQVLTDDVKGKRKAKVGKATYAPIVIYVYNHQAIGYFPQMSGQPAPAPKKTKPAKKDIQV